MWCALWRAAQSQSTRRCDRRRKEEQLGGDHHGAAEAEAGAGSVGEDGGREDVRSGEALTIIIKMMIKIIINNEDERAGEASAEARGGVGEADGDELVVEVELLACSQLEA